MNSNENEGGNKSKYKKPRSRVIDFLLISIFLFILFARAPMHDTDYDQLREQQICNELISLEHQLEIFKRQYYRYPETNEGLTALVDHPNFLKEKDYEQRRIKELLTDPWGETYLYEKVNDDLFEIMSYGDDRKPGGEESNVDTRFSECIKKEEYQKDRQTYKNLRRLKEWKPRKNKKTEVDLYELYNKRRANIKRGVAE